MIKLNIDDIVADAIKIAEKSTSKHARDSVFNLLGLSFDTWGQKAVDENSILMKAIVASPEFNVLKDKFSKQIIDEITKDSDTKPILNKKAISEIKRKLSYVIFDSVYENLENTYIETIVNDITAQLLQHDDFKPIIIANKIIEANSKKKDKE